MEDVDIKLISGLSLDDYGIFAVGDLSLDYIIHALPGTLDKGKIDLSHYRGIRVFDTSGIEMANADGPYLPDTMKEKGVWGWNLIDGDKHKSSKPSSNLGHLNYKDYSLFSDLEKRWGAGIANLARAFAMHSGDIPFEFAALRGKGKLDKIVEGVWNHFVPTDWVQEPSGLVFPNRTIIRTAPLLIPEAINLHPDLEFRIGTVLIDSAPRCLTIAGLNLYKSEQDDTGSVNGIVAITPKMGDSYDLISREAIPNGFIPVFNPTDLIKYAFRGINNPALKKSEKTLTYSDVLNALQKIRNEQGLRPQRIYVTLGEYGSIGIGTNGSIYRVSVLNAEGDNNTGAGDVFASVVTRYEHRRSMNKANRLPVYEILAYSSAASALHINHRPPYLQEIQEKLLSEGHAHYEEIGKINAINPNAGIFKRKISEVDGPVTGRYATLNFNSR